MTSSSGALEGLASPGLLTASRDIVGGAQRLLAAAKSGVQSRVASSGGFDAAQHATHGLAWYATTVEALGQLDAWGHRLDEAGRLGEIERLILALGSLEYAAQIAGGIPMSQGETARPSDLGIAQEAVRRFEDQLAKARADLDTDRMKARLAGLIAANATSTGTAVSVVVADGTHPPFAPGSFDHVLLDAPCSGLGVLRRRPDARWRVTERDVADLAALQQRLIDASAPLVRQGGTLTYSVCTLTSAESIDHRFPDGFEPLAAPGEPWEPFGTGARLLPQAADTDGMIVLRYRRGT